MKKIILSIIISSLSLSAFAVGVFNVQIPQPDFVSNDWDGDGIINSLDDNDDNDEYLDVDDSTPFGGTPGGSTTTPTIVTECLNDVNNRAVWMGNYMNFYVDGILISHSDNQPIEITNPETIASNRDFNLLGSRIYSGDPQTQVCTDSGGPSIGPVCLQDADNRAVWMGSYMNFYVDGILISPSDNQPVNIRDFEVLGHRIYSGSPYTQICIEPLN